MPTLRITQAGQNVETAFEEHGQARLAVIRPFSFALSPQDSEDIRWYLEDYRIYPVDPQPRIAARIEQRMNTIGCELFRLALAGSGVWASVRDRLGETRVEVETEVRGAVTPWELLCDPETNLSLALHAQAFVRSHSQAALRPKPALQPKGKIRILLAICRPDGASDVPFRSVARHLIRGLNAAAREAFELEVLRPPAFEQLSKRLREAKSQGKPFHVLHFDGHGDTGVVFFEDSANGAKSRPIAASELGKLLNETGVPVLILNACRSAHAVPPLAPLPMSSVNEQVCQFGSLAHSVMNDGAAGVVAWRYNVFVDTAAQFMADLYGALASGLPLGEAATFARKQLQSAPCPCEDWVVPVVFEAWPVRVFPQAAERIEIKLDASTPSESGLPQGPDVGFVGRDETILQLDRAFDEHHVALLHAFAGSGKTTAAAEFARWYRDTNGVGRLGPFTSFERYKSLAQVLDELGATFEPLLRQQKIEWLTLDHGKRRSVALQLLQQAPVLWIWDNVEPIAGFPAGTQSAWTVDEEEELVNFLRAARETKAKFLLTSRRAERGWLHDLPARIAQPPMSFEDSIEMTKKLAAKRGRKLHDVENWGPLLEFTQGNPLTLTVVVGQALRYGLRSRAEIEAYIAKLRRGETAFDDEESEGRTRSLAASLVYGFKGAFTDNELAQLALLHLFQGFVQVATLTWIGRSGTEHYPPQLTGLTSTSGAALLDRAVEVGILAPTTHGYFIHPAVPWFFRGLFDQHYGRERKRAERVFVEAMGDLGNYYHNYFSDGNHGVIGPLQSEEANLLHAWRLARLNSWADATTGVMQGLRVLYHHTGRRADWASLVEQTVPGFLNPATGRPLPGQDEHWSLILQYRIQVARNSRDIATAHRLAADRVAWDRQRAATELARRPQTWNADEMLAVQGCASSLHDLADIQFDMRLPSCVDRYREAMALAESIHDSQNAAVCALNLGNAFLYVGLIQDLSQAEQWYEQSLRLRSTGDLTGRAACWGQLGTVAYKRFEAAILANPSTEEWKRHLREAGTRYQQVLNVLPKSAVAELATTHNHLGLVNMNFGRTDVALNHYREAIKHVEAMGDRLRAGTTRYSAAVALCSVRRIHDAHEWAQAALRDYETCPGAEENVARTLALIEDIESGLPDLSPQL